MSDKYFDNVVLLLGFNGADGSSTFTDESSAGRTMTAAGAVIDTDQSKFGGASGLFDGNDQVTAADSADWLFPGACTVEAFVRVEAIPTVERVIVSQWRASPGERSWMLRANGSTLEFVVSTDGVASITASYPSAPWVTNTWHHVRGVIDATGTARVFFDGKLGQTTASVGASLNDSAQLLRVGARLDGAGAATAFWSGWIDELRITKGIGRSVGNFTPPRGPFSRGKRLGVFGQYSQPVIARPY